ncbi:mechanosensitive ion channel protein MscS [Halorubrum ezzemoulense]|uniref:Mechanosensitive ion channel family protein n=2 Tax=Halorubrum ezzemoulense TaxID=337243 RepID=A0A256K9T3_HALEZ|nr:MULTISPECIES: mechanosensitive ion channel family protein [Halorubrum]OYR57355.1 mechanosensitive ion channel protein MscS [Halorubrum ezzemoulense]OYR74400.1 mechanosensitive ion channel protein MscS [Halorubrum ezzemoulense]OYR77914.1 mechanosensitive ion channel protein MscS [Halorubrum ezzemoulense]PHQ43770.1 mechanosensitive ion channel protein MscS [Halorubrum sp. C191]QAY20966.1 mechanosensitive ion channel family protein [Halorubrum ezzemoulense]
MFPSPLTLFEGFSALEATVAVLVVSVAGALAMEFVVLRVARRYVSHTDTGYDDIVLSSLRAPLVVTAALAGVYVLTQVPSVRTSVLVEPRLLDAVFGLPSLSVIVLVWAYAANGVVNRLVAAVNAEGGRFDFAPVFSNVWTLAVLVGSAGTLLWLWGIEITPLLGAAGVAGIAVGFAAKDTVANFFGGIALYFDDTYKIGDYIVLDDGTAGTVIKVGVRSTTLLTRDEVLVTVPNAALNASKVTNESAPRRRRRVRVPIGVAYGTDVDAFEALAMDVVGAEPLVLDSPKPRARFRSFGDSSLQYEILCWVNGPTRRRRAQHELNRALYVALGDAGIEIPYPKRDVTVSGAVGPAAAARDGAPDPEQEPNTDADPSADADSSADAAT